MFSHALYLALIAAGVVAEKSPINANPTDTSNPILVGKRFPFNQLPEQVDTSSSARGTQYGYNICNSTTEGQTSLCQTAIINDITDFCLWGSPTPNTAIGDSESYEVAWCTKPTHGARLIPAGALTAVQFIKTDSYVQVTGQIVQEYLNLPTGDFGGELDSGGQDGRGNPIGGMVYSAQLPGGTTELPAQSASWSEFIGSDTFCFKACDPNAPMAVELCQHIYDRIGCNYNAPAAYAPGVFLSCLGEDQTPVGIYTSNGVVMTYHQEPEGVVPNPPYTPVIPATSQCTTYTSSVIYAGLPTVSVSISGSTSSTSTSTSSTSTATGAGAGAGGSSAGGSTTTSSAGSKPTGGAAQPATRGAALVPFAAVLLGAAFML